MYTISTDKSRLDIGMIHRFLSEDSYWARNILREVVERSIENAMCFGAYDGDRQIGFARVVTDRAVFAYIGDVFVLPHFRGKGISKKILRAILEHPDLQNLRRWYLVTSDAHDLYKQFGFAPLESADKHMELVIANPYG
ncbi:MAG TPA: GNAT family N-acetyltransferase [Thermoanaerobaculia bacterium]|nr:GNAT family N-acetyltransferase [Thermoanaerobaculia bacterium]